MSVGLRLKIRELSRSGEGRFWRGGGWEGTWRVGTGMEGWGGSSVDLNFDGRLF